jgi:hypothetical protein
MITVCIDDYPFETVIRLRVVKAGGGDALNSALFD